MPTTAPPERSQPEYRLVTGDFPGHGGWGGMYDIRPGPIHDIVEVFAVWQRQLSEDVSQAVAAGGLPAATIRSSSSSS
ncbi:hypothetical protein ACQPZQ_16655 [Pseudonocardia sp. CA-142604]|uniref:hypothetical protein n=1 Tax=Pseudonocardia sp. CA-142604 TaxID=3240024 RepID=UPI003D9465A0